MHTPTRRFVERSSSSHRRPLRRCLAIAAVGVLSVGALGAVGPQDAQADDVAGLQDQARQIAQRLNDLEAKVASIGERFNQSQVRIGQLDSQIADAKVRLDRARAEEQSRRTDLARFALSAYVGGNGSEALPLALDGRQWDMTRREGYQTIAVGDRQDLVDRLLAAQRVGDDTLAGLHDDQTTQAQLRSDLAAQQTEAARLMDAQAELQSSVQGKLADAVAQQQAALQAAAQAQAQARLQARFGTPPATQPGAATSPGNPAMPTVTPPEGTIPGATVPGGSTVTTTPASTPSNPTNPTVTAPPATNPPPVVQPPPTVTPPPPVSGRGQTAANAALAQLGARYSWGGGNARGASEGFGPGAGIVGFDCSGLTLYAWAQAGVSLYHSAQMQYDASRVVAISNLAVGDLVFYGSSSRSIDHVAIYIGNGQVVHAPNSRSLVQIGEVYLWGGYYPWVGAGRPG